MDRIAVKRTCDTGYNTDKCSTCNGYSEWTPTPPKPPSAFNRQIDGQHYTDCVIQPFEYSMANKLDPMQHTIIKYVTRFRSKNGIVDLEKAKHTLELLIEWEKNHATQKN